jgi:hypothetical protein
MRTYFGETKTNFQRAEFFLSDYTLWRPVGASHCSKRRLSWHCALKFIRLQENLVDEARHLESLFEYYNLDLAHV